MGVANGGQGSFDPWILKFEIFHYVFSKNGCFLSLQKKNNKFHNFWPPLENFMVSCEKIR